MVRAVLGVENDDAGAVLVQRPLELVGGGDVHQGANHLSAVEADLDAHALDGVLAELVADG